MRRSLPQQVDRRASGLHPALFKGADEVLGRSISDAEAAIFTKYLRLLEKWGSTFRIISSTRPDWIVKNLLLDSLLFLRVLPTNVRALLDFGAGAGVPGIPIKIVKPEFAVTLLEGHRRRASFLSAAVRELELSQTRVIHARAEEALNALRGSFDAVVMRCAGSLDTILPLASQFAVPGGIVIASGPPAARSLTAWKWITVSGLRPGTTRRFAVVRVGQ